MHAFKVYLQFLRKKPQGCQQKSVGRQGLLLQSVKALKQPGQKSQIAQHGPEQAHFATVIVKNQAARHPGLLGDGFGGGGVKTVAGEQVLGRLQNASLGATVVLN